MDHRLAQPFVFRVTCFKERIRAVSKSAFGLHVGSFFKVTSDGAVRRRLVSALFFLGAVCLGLAAHHSSQKEALKTWETRHGPTLNVARHSLASFGFHPIEEPKQLQAILRSLPLLTDPSFSFWITEDHSWTVLFEPVAGNGEPRLFSPVTDSKTARALKPKTNQWKFVGKGWVGFESLLRELAEANARKPATPAKAKQNAKTFSDPRALHY